MEQNVSFRSSALFYDYYSIYKIIVSDLLSMIVKLSAVSTSDTWSSEMCALVITYLGVNSDDKNGFNSGSSASLSCMLVFVTNTDLTVALQITKTTCCKLPRLNEMKTSHYYTVNSSFWFSCLNCHEREVSIGYVTDQLVSSRRNQFLEIGKIGLLYLPIAMSVS